MANSAFVLQPEEMVLLLAAVTVEGQLWVQVLARGNQCGWVARMCVRDTAVEQVFPDCKWVNLEQLDGRPEIFFWHCEAQCGRQTAAGGILAGSLAVLMQETATAVQVVWSNRRVWVQPSCAQKDY